MSAATIVTEGFGTFGSSNLVIVEGFALETSSVAEASLNIVYVLAENRTLYAFSEIESESRTVYAID